MDSQCCNCCKKSLMLVSHHKADYYENFDLQNIETPVKVDTFTKLLGQANYDPDEIRFLHEGFSQGFDIGYEGPKRRRSLSDNIPLKIGSETELWNKIMKEIKLKRVACPFDQIPYANFIQSPVGLVPKAEGQTRLIFHLSYDFNRGSEDRLLSLNKHTPRSKCSIKYHDLDFAVHAMLRLASLPDLDRKAKFNGLVYSRKTDIKSALRLVPLLQSCWKWLIFKARDPNSKEWKFFVDKCLPFGASISCVIFQHISDALKHVIEFRVSAQGDIANYLDDFLFIALMFLCCNFIISQFLLLYQEVGIPIVEEKTVWGTLRIVFLGVLLDGYILSLAVPMEKRNKAREILQSMVDRKKVMVKDLQSLCSLLNFLYKPIFLG